MKAIRVGDPVPELILAAHDGQRVSLADFKGKQAVVLFFYPADNTPICTTEAHSFRDAYRDFVEAGAVVIGVSADSASTHCAFAVKQHLPYLLVSDKDGSLRRALGVRKTFGLFPGRVTYVIDCAGIVRHVCYAQFAARRHVEEALRAVQTLKSQPGPHA